MIIPSHTASEEQTAREGVESMLTLGIAQVSDDFPDRGSELCEHDYFGSGSASWVTGEVLCQELWGVEVQEDHYIIISLVFHL